MSILLPHINQAALHHRKSRPVVFFHGFGAELFQHHNGMIGIVGPQIEGVGDYTDIGANAAKLDDIL